MTASIAECRKTVPNLSIKLLGEFNIAYANSSITSVKTERLQALLVYVLLHRDRPQPRQQIAVQLWPEASETEAKASLRRRLHELRQLLPNADQFLQVESRSLQWISDGPYSLDVADFEAAIAQAQAAQRSQQLTRARQALVRATELYRGELLPGCYDDWIVGPRDTLRQQAINTLDQLVTLLFKQGDRQTAMGYAQQLLRLDPLAETAYCHLMRLHSQAGDRASALRVYHQCMTILQEELGVNPSPTTCKLYEQILTLDEPLLASSSSPQQLSASGDCQVPGLKLPAPEQLSPPSPALPPPTTAIPLIGRKPEWAEIQHWKNARQKVGKSELLLLVGESGIGKTRLLEELAQAVRAEGGLVLWGRGFEAEMLRPYGVWIDAFRSLPNHEFLSEITTRLLNPHPPAGGGLDRSRLFDAGVQFLQQLMSHHRCVLIVLDDIQWLDEASVAFLHYAARLLSQAPILFACAARTQELERNPAVSKVLQAFYREQWVQRLELAPLAPASTAELAHQISQDIDGNHVFADSGGNPLFALEVARALSQAAGPNSNQPFSHDLSTLIQGRLLPLDESARQLVCWGAALGRSFNPTTLAQVTDYAPLQLLTALERLEAHGIIRPGNTVNGEIYYDFAHDIVRQAAYQQLSEPRRRLAHAHIAQALNRLLDSHPGEVSNVAYHASLGGDHELAASASLQAAERHLRLFAFAEASEIAQQGIHHCQYLNPAAQIPLHLRLLRAYVKAGVRKEQVSSLETELQRLIEQASAKGLKDEQAIGLEALIMLSYDHGRLTQVQQHSLQAAEQARLASPTTTAYMLARTGSCLADIGREMTRAEALLLEAQSLAERVGLQAIDISSGLGIIRRYQGKVEDARQLLEQGWKIAQMEQDHWRECPCLINLVMLELEADNLVNALNYCHELTTVSAQMAEGSEADHAAALDALIQYLLGTPEADSALERSLQSLKRLDSPRMTAFIQTLAAEFDLRQGRPKSAIARAEAAFEAARIVDNHSEIALAWAMIIRASLQMGNLKCATQHFLSLQQKISQAFLSHRARQALQAIEAQLQALKP